MPGRFPNALTNLLKGFPIQPTSAEYGFRSYSSIEPLVNGDEILPAILDLIRKSSSSIQFQVMLFHPDAAGMEISGELVEAANRGVSVQLMFNHRMSTSGSIAYRYPKERIRQFSKSFIRLKEQWENAGIQVLDNIAGLPKRSRVRNDGVAELEKRLREDIIFNFNHIDHRKFVIVDGKVAIVGGANVAEEYLYKIPPNFYLNMREASESRKKGNKPEPWEKWLDLAIKIEGQIILDLIKEFQIRWEILGGASIDIWQDENTTSIGKVRLLAQRPGHHEIASELIDRFNKAKESIYVASPYVSHPEIIAALCKAAKRGTKVVFTYPAKFNDIDLSVRIIRHFTIKMLEAGVHIYENNNRKVHTKLTIIDSSNAVIGSANLNYRSMVHDYELVLLIEDQELVAELETRTFNIYLRDSEKVTSAIGSGLTIFDRFSIPFS